MKVKDCMCTETYTCNVDNTVSECAKVMNSYHVGCVPVCDDNEKVVGLITDRDIVLRCIANEKDAKKLKIKEIMTKNIWCCNPEDELQNIENKMINQQIRRIPVINNESRLIGILTLGDLAKHQDISGQELGCTVEKICNCDNKNCS